MLFVRIQVKHQNTLNSSMVHFQNLPQDRWAVLISFVNQISLVQNIGLKFIMQAQPESIVPPSISLTSPQTHPCGYYHTYLVQGTDQYGSFSIRRCFHDFTILRERMFRQWPGCYLPSLPPKKSVWSPDDQLYVEHHRRFLEFFCKKVATRPEMYESRLFQVMLRYEGEEVEKVTGFEVIKGFKEVEKQTTKDIVEKYEVLYGESLSKMLLFDLNKKIDDFTSFLKKAETNLKKICQQVNALAQARMQYEKLLNNTNIMLLPGFEAQFLAFQLQNQPTNVCYQFPMKSNPEVKDAQQYYQAYSEHSSSDFLSNVIHLQLRQLQVMHRLIDDLNSKQHESKKLQNSRASHQQQLSKLLSGKTTLKSMFKMSPKEQQIMDLQQKIEEQHRQIESLQTLIEYMIRIIGGIEIDLFKETKKNQYYQNMNIVSKLEIRNLVSYGALQKCIAIALDPFYDQITTQSSKLMVINEKTAPLVKQQLFSIQGEPRQVYDEQLSEVKSCHMSPQKSQPQSPVPK